MRAGASSHTSETFSTRRLHYENDHAFGFRSRARYPRFTLRVAFGVVAVNRRQFLAGLLASAAPIPPLPEPMCASMYINSRRLYGIGSAGEIMRGMIVSLAFDGENYRITDVEPAEEEDTDVEMEGARLRG